MNMKLQTQKKDPFDTMARFPERCLSFSLAVFVLGMILYLPHAPGVSAALLEEQQGDAKRGQQVFENRCSGCHSLDQDKEGPRLRGVFGNKAGSVPTFKYSDAMKASNITWDVESLDQWLADPDKIVPNSDMAFRVPKANERKDVIAYLQQLSK
jgi:cytochrome c